MGKLCLLFLLLTVEGFASPLCRFLAPSEGVPKITDGESAIVIGATPDREGHLYLSRITGKEVPFEVGWVLKILREKKHPIGELLRELGLSIYSEGGVEYLIHPDVASLNVRLEKLGLAPRFEWDISEGGTGPIEFARMVARGRFPIASKGLEKGRSLYFHDLMVHGIGYSLLPASVMRSIQARMSVLLELHERFATRPEIQKSVRRAIEEDIRQLDLESSYLLENVFLLEQHPMVTIQLGRLVSASPLRGWLGSVPVGQLTAQDRAWTREQIQKLDELSPERSEREKLAEQLLRSFGPRK